MKRRWEWLTETINKNGYFNIVELGVHQAQNARYIVEHSVIANVTGIDLWYGTSDYPMDRNPHMKAAYELAENSSRFSVIRMDTSAAASLFKDGTVDLVFIDGDHSRSGCLRDLVAWYPKVRSTGILCGHDLGKPGVQAALDQFGKPYEAVGVDNCWRLV